AERWNLIPLNLKTVLPIYHVLMLNLKKHINEQKVIQMYDVIIIGAGPAGLAAAISCRENDLQTLVLDEFPEIGGRLLGQLHQEPNGEWWNGIKETKILKERAFELDTEIRLGVSVYHIEKTDHGF